MDRRTRFVSASRVVVGIVAALGVTLLFAGTARGEPQVGRRLFLTEGSIELGLGATVVGGGGQIAGTFLGSTFTVQGSHFRPLAGVFQIGLGAGLDEDPVDPDATRSRAQVWLALGARFRPFTLASVLPRGLDVFVGPLFGVLLNHPVVVFTAAGELGVSYQMGRLRLSLAVHGGWADILHQNVPGRLEAAWCAGGQLSVGLVF